LLSKYNLVIILFVGSIVVVGSVKSTVTSTGVEASTQPTKDFPEDKVGPIGVPELSVNCIST
jgi:hypothetical protein